MKLSVSLTEEDVAILDAFTREAGLPSRSAALQVAVRSLALAGIEDDYAAAWDEWEASGEHGEWESAASDGLASAAG